MLWPSTRSVSFREGRRRSASDLRFNGALRTNRRGAVNTPSQDNQRSKRLAAIAADAVSAFVLSWFFRVPLVPVLVGIAVAAKLGSSENWRTGLFYGVVIGPSGYAVRVFLYPPDQAIVALWQNGLLLLAIAAIYGLVGIGINKLVTGRGSLMW